MPGGLRTDFDDEGIRHGPALIDSLPTTDLLAIVPGVWRSCGFSACDRTAPPQGRRGAERAAPRVTRLAHFAVLAADARSGDLTSCPCVPANLCYEGPMAGRTDMMSKFALTMLTALAISGPVQEAAAQESTLGGAMVGGVLGGDCRRRARWPRRCGGRRDRRRRHRCAIGAQGEPRPGGYRYYQNGCYVEQPGGWVAVSPRYCQTAGAMTAPAAAGLCRAAAPALHLLADLRSAPRHVRRP